MTENPFKVLGILPSVLKGLSDERIFQIVKGAYRALSKIYHPDTGGSQKMFVLINTAFRELDLNANPASFKYWKEMYLKPHKTKIERLEREIELAESKNLLWQELFGSLVATMSSLDDDPASIGNIRSTSFILNDVIERLMVDKLSTSRVVYSRHFDPHEKIRANEYSPKCEIVVDHEGRLTRYDLKRTAFDSDLHKEIPPHYFEITSMANYTLERVSGQPLSGRLVGCFSDGWKHETNPKTREISDAKYRGLKGALPSDIYEEVFQNRLIGFPVNHLEIFLPFWKSRVQVGRYLLSSNLSGGEARIVILGEIRSIMPLENL